MAKLGVVLESIELDQSGGLFKPTALFDRCKVGTLVAVRPCADKYKDKTFLGMYIGSLPTHLQATERDGKILLTLTDYKNPCIYIPELDECVWGMGSWWGEIKDEEHLRQITDEDIQNVWYVRALKQMTEAKENEETT